MSEIENDKELIEAAKAYLKQLRYNNTIVLNHETDVNQHVYLSDLLTDFTKQQLKTPHPNHVCLHCGCALKDSNEELVELRKKLKEYDDWFDEIARKS